MSQNSLNTRPKTAATEIEKLKQRARSSRAIEEAGKSLSPKAKSRATPPRIVQQPLSLRLRAMITMSVKRFRLHEMDSA